MVSRTLANSCASNGRLPCHDVGITLQWGCKNLLRLRDL
jgi:hypothetical protein